MVDDTIGINTALTLMSPIKGSFTIEVTDPNGEQLPLPIEEEITNWNSPDSSIGVSWGKIADVAVSLVHYFY